MSNPPNPDLPPRPPITEPQQDTEPAPSIDEAAPPIDDTTPLIAETTPDDDSGLSATLDEGTYSTLIQPRAASRLELAHGVWHQISRKYLWVQLISNGIFLAVVVVATLVLGLALHQTWAFIPGGILTVILVWVIAILPRQVRAMGYQLRRDDFIFRRGILWQRFVAVPYGRMQLVDISHGPLDRGFGIAQLKFVTAAAVTGVVIPGLEQQTAETLRDHLVAVAESRRTGL